MRRSLIPALAAVTVLATAVSLGNWQMRRALEKEALQGQRDAQRVEQPLLVGRALADGPALDGRRVSVQGTFVAQGTIFLDNRTRRGVAGFHVVTPLRLTAGDGDPGVERGAMHVLVLRGWIAGDPMDRGRLPALETPTGAIHLEGIAHARLDQPIVLREDPEPGPNERIWQHLEADRYARWAGLAVQPVVLRQLTELPDGLARDWVQPAASADKHRAYAFQWYAIAAVTGGLWAYLGWIRPRRRTIGWRRPADERRR